VLLHNIQSSADLPGPVDAGLFCWFLDYDGTIAPIEAHPENVHTPPETLDLLKHLSRRSGGAVAILSGRAYADVFARVPGELVIAGSHGAELADGGIAGSGLAALRDAYLALEPLTVQEGVWMEKKPAGVAVHYRAAPQAETLCREAVTRAVKSIQGLRAIHGKCVSEAALATHSKGTALAELAGNPPFAGRRPIMVGDDTTDEDGFRAAQALGGFGIRIGPGTSVARFRIDTRENFIAWLSQVVEEG